MNNVRTKMFTVLLSGAAAGLGCSDGGSVDIGSTSAIGSQLSDYAATWDGHAEAYTFWPDGSDRVRLTLDTSGQGSLEIGNADLLPPPTDPNVGYPAESDWLPDGRATGSGTPGVLVEGVLYPVHASVIESGRIHIGIDPNDLYTDWCQLQTSYDWTDPTNGVPAYGCVPRPESETTDAMADTCILNLADGTTQSVDCGKWNLCFTSMACTCTATSCVANTVPIGTPTSGYSSQLDGVPDSSDATLIATLLLPGPDRRVTVVLQRQ